VRPPGKASVASRGLRPAALLMIQRIPYPPDKGEKIRHFHVLEELRKSHDVHLGCLVDDPADWQYVPHVRAMCRSSHFARVNRQLAAGRYIRGLLRGDALSVAYFQDSGLRQYVADVLRTVRPEVVFICSSNMAPYVLGQSNIGSVKLADLVDVDSEKWRAYAETTRGPLRWIYRRERRLIAALEQRIADECDYTTFVSQAEAALFANLVPPHAKRARAVTNGVDHVYFDPARKYPTPYDDDRPKFIFCGTMDYPPNIDASEWFARDILPRIHKDHPEAQFCVVGSSPTVRVQRLAKLNGVLVTGRVPDVRPFVAHATASVAPMRIARGIQNKVLEAMAMAKPCIVTSAALEGIRAVAGEEVMLADDASSFAQAASEIIRAKTDGGVGAAARRRVLADYDWSKCLSGFAPLLKAG
jgi:sugar transferase (PEP-CTERM/EpsH1 system associated)